MALISLWLLPITPAALEREVHPPETGSPHQPVLLYVGPDGFCFKDAKGRTIAAPWGGKKGM